jgi:hypothetical protein
MKRVGVREVHDTATKYLAGNEVLATERHGQQVGVSIPTAGERAGPPKRWSASVGPSSASWSRPE